MIKGRRLKKALVYGAVIATLGSAVWASDFKNSIVNIKFYKAANNLVRINFVTSKPYLSKICVMNKDTNKYVILLAETENKMTTNPLTCDFADVLTGINITTHPYISEGCKGYTKIVISTTKPVTFSAVSSVAVQNSDATKIATAQNAVELGKALPKTTKPATQPVQKTASPTVAQTPQKIAQATPTSLPVQTPTPVQTQKLVQTPKPIQQTKAEQTAKPVVMPKATSTPKTQTTIKHIEQEKLIPEKIKPVVKFEDEDAQIDIVAENKVPTKIAEQPKQENIKPKKQHKPVISTDIIKQIQNRLILSADNAKANMANINNDVQEIINLLYLDIDFKKLLLILSAIGFPIAVIFYIVLANRRLKQRVKKFNESHANTNTAPVSESVVEEFVEDDFVPEQAPTFDEVLETSEPANIQIPDSISFEQLEGLMGMETEETDTEELDEVTAEDVFETVEPVEEIEDEIADEVIAEEVLEPVEPVEEIEDEIADEVTTEEVFEPVEPVEEIEDEIADEVIAEEVLEPVEPVEEIEDEIADEEIAEEVLEPVEPVEEIEDEIGDEVTAEDVFEPVEPVEEIEDEIADEEIAEEVFEPVEPVEEIEDEIGNEEIAEEVFEPDGFVDAFDDDTVFDDLISSNSDFYEETETATDDEVFDDLRTEYETTVDGLRVLAQTTLDNERGFYLVNFENFSSLIGYVQEEVYVLKTFDEFVNSSIFLKLAEQLPGNSARYIIRIGTYKMAVEVTETQMHHIIDL